MHGGCSWKRASKVRRDARLCWFFILFYLFIRALSASPNRCEYSTVRVPMDKENPGYVYACGWNRLNMRVIGAWPEGNQNLMVKNGALGCAMLIFVLIWLPQTASIAFFRGDLNELIGCLVINVPVAISVFKLVLFRLRREVLSSILSSMAKDWSMPRTNDELKEMLEKAKYGRFISIMSVSLATSMFFAFSGFGRKNRIAISGFNYVQLPSLGQVSLSQTWEAMKERRSSTNETTDLAIGFLYPAYFPFDTKASSRYLPTWIAQLFGTVFSMIGYSGPDSSMAMMILHLCGQLATMRIALVNIVDEECIADPSVYWKRLSSIIKRHEELNRYAEMLERSFNGMLLIQMIVCTITFCFQGFVTFTTLIGSLTGEQDFPVLQMVFFVTHSTIFGFYTILHLFVYCWAGDLLVVESTALSHAPYESDWFRLPPDQAKALMMVTSRSRIPLRITAGKFVGFSLELFTSIMKTSMGYLSVLLAMQDDH